MQNPTDLPLVTVMTPVYNPDASFKNCLRSVAYQDYPNIEHIVIDDGSAKDVENFVENSPNPERVRFQRLKENQGRGAARQAALEMAKGQYITMVDADDWIFSNKISAQVQHLEEYPELALTSCSMYMANNSGALLGIDDFGISDSLFFQKIPNPGVLPIPHAPSMIRTKIAQQHHYNPELKSSEDFDFLLKILLKNPFSFINQPLYVYSYERSKSLERLRYQLAQSRKVMRQYVTRHPLTSFRYIGRSFAHEAFYCGISSSQSLKSLFLKNRYTPVDLKREMEYNKMKLSLEA